MPARKVNFVQEGANRGWDQGQSPDGVRGAKTPDNTNNNPSKFYIYQESRYRDSR